MGEYLKLKKSNCKDCYKCIRHCPVKSISFINHQATIIEDECILCGMCFVTCPQNAKEVRNDIYKAKALINSGADVYVSLAPSFIANYEGYNFESLDDALKHLGFKGTFETAEGATGVKNAYDELVNKNDSDVIISTCCHSVNLLVQKHFPEATKYLAKVASPMQAHAKRIKKDHPGCAVVFIGPCISKKAEAESYPGDVDCVLTFEELSYWLEEEKISLKKLPDVKAFGKTRLFPTSGGILETMKKNNPDYHYLFVDGVENCIRTIKNILSGGIHKCFIEMSACVGSCIGGPAIVKKEHNLLKDYLLIDSYAGDTDFEFRTDDILLSKNIEKSNIHLAMPSDLDIREIFEKMGKFSKEKELNCGSCGYNTCYDKAVAIYRGKADPSMCLPFIKEKAETFSDNIIGITPNGILVLNDSFEIQLINKSACDILNIKNSSDVIGMPVIRILDPSDFVNVSMTKEAITEKKVFLADYKKTIEETITYDEKYHIIICIMRDITSLENAKSEKEVISRNTIEITDKVIQKQMRVVQEIASLLGETTAETKIALTKLKESLKDD